MHNDIYGRQVLTENDLCVAYLKNPDILIRNALVDADINISDVLELDSTPTVVRYIQNTESVEQFDNISQDKWYIPDEYRNMDIAQWVLDQCKEDYELQRVGQELLLYQEKDLFPLLCYCKYLVDTV
jgi:hypothetical protein